MTGFLLDTNIPSELTRSRPEPGVVDWLDTIDDERLYISVITLGEIRKGIKLLANGRRRQALEQWMETTLRPWFEGRVLPIDASIAERWGALAAQCQLTGRALKVADGLIAATAIVHNLSIATRNVKDVENLGVEVFNPWKE